MSFTYNNYLSHKTPFPFIYIFLLRIYSNGYTKNTNYGLTVEIALQQILLWDSSGTMWGAK